MESAKPIEIPESHIEFANAVAALAKQNHIAKFELKYDPHDEYDKGQPWGRQVRGEAVIRFSDKDGRGRPCRNLSIEFEARHSHSIVSTPESSN